MVRHMHIYNYKQNSQSPHHILDPDYTYHTSYEAEILYHFFKNLIIPQNINTMASIYIEYQVLPFLFVKYPFIYQKISPYILKEIMQYLDFGNANLYTNQTNMFFIIMFDVTSEQINTAFLNLKKHLIQKNFLYKNHNCQFDIKCGVYFSHTYIHPFEFYKCAQEQFNNTLKHEEIMISIKELSL